MASVHDLMKPQLVAMKRRLTEIDTELRDGGDLHKFATAADDLAEQVDKLVGRVQAAIDALEEKPAA